MIRVGGWVVCVGVNGWVVRKGVRYSTNQSLFLSFAGTLDYIYQSSANQNKFRINEWKTDEFYCHSNKFNNITIMTENYITYDKAELNFG